MSGNPKVQLGIDEILPHIYWVHKPITRALDSSNGILICTPTEAITIDVNMPEPELHVMYEFLGKLPHTTHINTHFHLDHIIHLHLYQELGKTEIYVPAPDAEYVRTPEKHRKDYGYDDVGLAEPWMNLLFNEFHYKPVHSYKAFNLTETLRFGEVELQPISFPGHGPGHVGFHVNVLASNQFTERSQQFLFYSDIGIDIGGQEFGPWYGFKILKVKEVRSDVDRAEFLHKSLNVPMISSHGLPYRQYTPEPYTYIRSKVQNREDKILQVLKNLGGKASVQQLMPYDIFYPKSKMKGNLKLLVNYWEEGFLTNHLIDLEARGKVRREDQVFHLLI